MSICFSTLVALHVSLKLFIYLLLCLLSNGLLLLGLLHQSVGITQDVNCCLVLKNTALRGGQSRKNAVLQFFEVPEK